MDCTCTYQEHHAGVGSFKLVATWHLSSEHLYQHTGSRPDVGREGGLTLADHLGEGEGERERGGGEGGGKEGRE